MAGLRNTLTLCGPTPFFAAPAGRRSDRARSAARPAMTLVELLVVLAILSVLTLVAVTSADTLLDQGRYDGTVRTMAAVEEAVAGLAPRPSAASAGGTPGFIADIGRMPAMQGADPAAGLSELWSAPSLAPFAVRPAPTDPEVLVPCGWRGPYLRLPIGSSHLRDGWGNDFELLSSSGQPASAGEPIAGVASAGAAGTRSTSGYSVPLTVSWPVERLSIAVSGHVYELDATGQRNNPASPSQVRVVLFGPDAATGDVSETPLATQIQDGVVSYAFTSLGGPRFLRAYVGAPATRKSPVVRIDRSDVVHLDLR